MKKFISVLLIIAVIMSVFSVGITSYATESDSIYSDYINYRAGLPNTYAKLTSGEKKLNVVYFGGSVTAGHGAPSESWRVLVGKWLGENFPEASITNINSACGESGTYLGAYRFERDVIESKPDLLFIEYSINDKYFGTSFEQSAIQFETIVRKVRQELPECDIVTILVTDNGVANDARKENGSVLHEQAQAHEYISQEYNIPSIHVGRALADALPSGWTYDADWLKYMTDIVHPNATGYKLYYDVIEEFLVKALADENNDGVSVKYTVPNLVSSHLFDGDVTVILPSQNLINTSNQMGGKGFTYTSGSFGITNYNSYLLANLTDSELYLTFTGTELVMLEDGGNTTATFKVKVDNGEYVTKKFSDKNPVTVVEGLKSGTHTVAIKPDISALTDKRLWIGAFYSRDESKQTTSDITLDKNLYGKNETVTVTFADGLVADTIKVWKNGTTQDEAIINQSVAADATSFQFSTKDVEKGSYSVAVYFNNERLANAMFTLDSIRSIKMNKTEYACGEDLTFTYTGVEDSEWLGLYWKEFYDSAKYDMYNKVDTLYLGPNAQWVHRLDAFPSKELSRYLYFKEEFPFPPGEYITVMYNNGYNVVATSETFTILPPETAVSFSTTEFNRGDIVQIPLTRFAELDQIKVWSVYEDETNPVFEADVESYKDEIFLDTSDLGEEEYTVAAYLDGEMINSQDIYVKLVEMKNTGTEIKVFEDETYIDLSDEKHDEIEGKLFVGWTDENGNSLETAAEYPAGTVLKAQYIDFTGEEFEIAGVQMKPSGAQQIRYVFNTKNEMVAALPEFIDMGAMVMSPEILNDKELNWAEIEYGKTYTVAGEDYTPDYYALSEISNQDGVISSGFSFDVAENEYDKEFTARGYIRYKDYNGIDNIIYTDEYQTSIFTIAEYTYNFRRGEISATAKATMKSITDNIKNTVKAKYDTKRNVVYGSEEFLGTYIYRLEDSNLMVREHVIDSGLGGEEVTIVQINDVHFNYLNEKDWEEANPTLLSTYQGRTWLKNAESAPIIRGVLNYAKQTDLLVAAGDILDYLSHGAVELTHKEIWRYFPSALITVGNHELPQKMQGQVAETLTAAERRAWLESVWKHDMDYTSRVLKNKVMAIQLDNGSNTFTTNQAVKLKADLETARAKGYTVLLFMHIPLLTNNPAESNVPPIRTDDSSAPADFYKNSAGDVCVKPTDLGSGNAKDQVYSLITNNGDIIKGVYNGHFHADFYTEIMAKTADGEDTVIPQYTVTGSIYQRDGASGHALKITVK